MGTVDKAALFAPRLPEDDVELVGVGTVRVRALNRDEAMEAGKIDDRKMRDRHIIAMGMVEPALSVSEVKQWGAAATAGEIEKVSRRIAELSGMIEGADKEVVKTFHSGSVD